MIVTVKYKLGGEFKLKDVTTIREDKHYYYIENKGELVDIFKKHIIGIYAEGETNGNN